MDETAAKLLEQLSLSESNSLAGLQIDRDNCIIRNVKILGDTSKNRHPVSGKQFKYTDGALKGFAKLQEGARVFLNHPNPKDPSPRSYGDQLGEFRNVETRLQVVPRGNFGEFHYNPKHPLAEQILHDAEHAPHRLAMSHLATGAGRPDGNWHLVEEAKSVESVDLVCRGATNTSLFESAPTTTTVEDTTAMDELKQENEALKAKIAELEESAEKRKKADQRRSELTAAGVEATDALVEQLAAVADESAAVLIEAMKPKAPAAKPTSRDPNTPKPELSHDSFLSSLGG